MNTVSQLAALLADRYRIERELGSGGMATVCLATELKHSRAVAIKVLKPEIAVALAPSDSFAKSASQRNWITRTSSR